MSILPNLRSLCLATLLSFAVPILLFGAVLAGLSLVGYVPGLEDIGQAGATSILSFLAVFGSGCPVQGLLIIGMSCGLVGGLFDTYTSYRYQKLSGN